MAKKDYDALARFILEHVGGKDNVISLTHCITRLRFKLKDEGRADTAALKRNDGVVDVIQKGGQYQVVIGNDVELAFDAVNKLAGFGDAELAAADEKFEGNLFDRFVDMISGAFMPALGILTATGVIKGLAALLAAIGVIARTSGTYNILYAMGDCILYFFPVVLGSTSAKKFGLNQFTGLAIGLTMVYPALSGLTSGEPIMTLFAGTLFESPVYVTFCGVPVILMSYTSTIIPILITTYFASKVERVAKSIVPQILQRIFVPALTLLVAVPVAFIAIGPVATWISDIIGAAAMAIYNFSPIVAGAVIGGFWQVLVMFGMHLGVVPIASNNLATNGWDFIMPCMICTPIATAGVVLSIALKTKNPKLKAIAFPAAVSSFLGVSEPSIYGVTLPRKKPFFITLFCAGVGGVITALFGTRMYINGGMGLLAFPNYINPETGFDTPFFGLLVAWAVAFTLAFVLTWAIGFSDKGDILEEESEPRDEQASGSDLIKQEVFMAPVAGEVVDLADVSDEVFASGALGKGVAVKPSDGNVYAPCDGVVSALFPTGHAVGITAAASGAELLIHIGIDTVQLDGKGFTKHVAAGDTVTRGQLLISFDRDLIAREGYDDTVMFIVSNTASFQDVVRAHDAAAATDRELLAVAV